MGRSTVHIGSLVRGHNRVVLLGAAVLLVATAAGCSSGDTHHAAAATPTTSGAKLLPAPKAERDTPDEDGGDGDAQRKPFIPQSPNDHTLTALPLASPAVGPAWTFLGPRPVSNLRNFVGGGTHRWGNNSGRITSIVTSPLASTTAYAGSAGGGVWKTADGGTTWVPTTDTQASLSIGALAIDPTGTTIVAGTGEENFSESMPGQGVLISTNRAGTWTLTGRTTFGNHYIGGVAIDRRTSGATLRILVASDLGLYTSSNAGATWTKNTNFSAAAPGYAFQVIEDRTTAGTFWATSASPNTFSTPCASNPAASVAKSTDGGVTWHSVLRPAHVTRVGLGIGSGGTAYAALSNCAGVSAGIEKTVNYGASWSFPGVPPPFFNPTGGGTGQGYYDNVVAVDPTNNNNVVAGGVDVIASSTGGTTWTDVGKLYAGGTIHPDYHAITFTGAKTFYVGNDGGVWHSTDLGTTFTNLNATLGVTQFYRGATTDLSHVVGGSQDNAAMGDYGTTAKAWTMFGGGGDAGFAAIDPTVGSKYVYVESQSGNIVRASSAAPTPGVPAGPCAGCPGNSFITPFVMDPSNPKRLLTPTDLTGGGQGIMESRNDATYTGGVPASTGWSLISGVYIASGTDSINSIAVGPAGDGGVVYALDASGAVRRSTNALGARVMPGQVATWTGVTGNLPSASVGTALAGWDYGSTIVFNPWNINEAWASTTHIGAGTSPLWHTTNANSASPTWTPLTGVLANTPGLGLAVDPRNPKTVYLGTSGGVFVCTTCGGTGATANWTRFGTGMPNVWVNDLTFTRDHSSLIAWTHGRGAWAIPTPDTASLTPITEYPVTGASQPTAMTAGPNGPWFVDSGTGKIGHINANGTTTTYVAGAAGDQVNAVVEGPDGNLWYTASNGNYIGMIKPDGTGNVHYPMPAAGVHPFGIAFGADGNLWVTENFDSVIDQFRPILHTWGIRVGTPTHNARPEYMTTGADGNVWFTEFTGLKVAKIDNAGTITEYPAPTNVGDTTGPYGIGLGPDGNVWFTNYTDNTITSVTPAGAMHKVTVGTGMHGPVGIAIGLDGDLWVADGGAQNVVVRIDPTTYALTKYTLPTAFASAFGIAPGPDGNLWFTESSHGAVARMQLSQS